MYTLFALLHYAAAMALLDADVARRIRCFRLPLMLMLPATLCYAVAFEHRV